MIMPGLYRILLMTKSKSTLPETKRPSNQQTDKLPNKRKLSATILKLISFQFLIFSFMRSV